MRTEGLTVFYDGGCSLCGREIAHYRRLEALLPIDWIDVIRESGELAAYGLDVPQVMAEFHVIDQHGALFRGADAFLRLWFALPYYRHLSSVCCALGLPPIMRRIYRRFARWHFRRRCADGACTAV